MKKIILGVSSSISAYKSCEIARLFVKGGYSVNVVLTKNAEKLVTPLTFSALTGNSALTDNSSWERNSMEHINLKDDASLMLVAPATANIIGKFASGISDDLLSTTFLSVKCPVMIAPAMNPNMYTHIAVQENLKKLSGWGVMIVEPEAGLVACGDEGVGRLASVDEIYRRAVKVLEG